MTRIEAGASRGGIVIPRLKRFPRPGRIERPEPGNAATAAAVPGTTWAGEGGGTTREGSDEGERISRDGSW